MFLAYGLMVLGCLGLWRSVTYQGPDWRSNAIAVGSCGYLLLPGLVLMHANPFSLGMVAALVGYPILRAEYVPAMVKRIKR